LRGNARAEREREDWTAVATMWQHAYPSRLCVDPCHLRYLCQGKDPAATDPYNMLPWRLGLLTQTNSSC